METKTDIKTLTSDELLSWLQEHGIKPYRGSQILKWIYHRQADTFAEMTDLSIDIRTLLADHFIIARLEQETIEVSRDGSKKYLFKLADGEHIESVLIPEKDHYTLCISSQAGCAQGCKFCMTATRGLSRNLTAAEIIGQVRDIVRDVSGPVLKKGHIPEEMPLSNVVFMGMGEPLANYGHLINALTVLNDNESGLCFSNRKITVSTAGVIPNMHKLGRDTRVNLAISLNATDNKTRETLMPINRKYPIEDLIEACRQFPMTGRRMITFEYILMKGINDSEADARRLAALLHPVRAKINLIPFNTHEGSEFNRPDESVILRFQQILHDKSYTCVIRRSKGQDISAACGQLRAKVL